MCCWIVRSCMGHLHMATYRSDAATAAGECRCHRQGGRPDLSLTSLQWLAVARVGATPTPVGLRRHLLGGEASGGERVTYGVDHGRLAEHVSVADALGQRYGTYGGQ